MITTADIVAVKKFETKRGNESSSISRRRCMSINVVLIQVAAAEEVEPRLNEEVISSNSDMRIAPLTDSQILRIRHLETLAKIRYRAPRAMKKRNWSELLEKLILWETLVRGIAMAVSVRTETIVIMVAMEALDDFPRTNEKRRRKILNWFTCSPLQLYLQCRTVVPFADKISGCLGGGF